MPTLVDHSLVAPLLIEEFDALSDLCGRFTETEWSRPCLPGWTVKDVLAHIVGTESMLLGEPAPTGEVRAYEHVKNPTGQFNETWVESLRPLAGAEVLARFREVAAKRAAALREMTQADFDKSAWTPAGADETYGRFMRIRHFDCFLHELDIRAAVEAADREDPPHVELALSEPLAALGYIVGKKVGLPQGTSARLRLTGPVNQTHHVVVAERARVVDAIDGEPTCGIAVPAVLFLRLAGGRVDPLPYLGDPITLEGDPELATRLATNLAYTI